MTWQFRSARPLPSVQPAGQARPVHVREWDPATAPADEVTSVVRALNLVIAADMPEDPPWRADSLREYLSVTMPGERRICWIAENNDEILGYATILLLGGIGVLELLVHPKARRTSVGSDLLTVAAKRADLEGFASLGVEVIGGTPAAQFYEAHGFDCAFVEMRNVLNLSNVDWPAIDKMAHSVGSGYRVEFHSGELPEDMFEPYAAAKSAMRTVPSQELELRPSSYDSDRLRASINTLRARGLKPYVVLAVHERTESVAGLTEVVVPAQRPTRADQYDTVVVPAHRGYGLGRALKARMLLELRAAEPQLIDVQTWNALENEPMLRVNADLGFEPDRQWWEYEANISQLLRRLQSA
jgi:GNAT superfamily N-acetyltransferase